MGTRRHALIVAALAVLIAPAFGFAEARMNFVGPKSIYAKAGLRTNDIVINIDGIVPKSGIEVGQLVHERIGDGKKHKMLIRRGGEHITLEFGP